MKTFLALFLTSIILTCHADPSILMARSGEKADVSFQQTKTLLEEYGYTVAFVQTCDGGMKKLGYQSDFYRVIFFGKPEEIRTISNNYPSLTPFIPLKMVVFAENDETVISVINPENFSVASNNPQLQVLLERWKSDLLSILNELSMTH